MSSCDGCLKARDVKDLSFRSANGHECHYCGDCDSVYAQWLHAMLGEEARLNSLLDVFIKESRNGISLRSVPQDFPKIDVRLDRVSLG